MASAASTITVRCTDGFTHTVDGSAAAAASSGSGAAGGGGTGAEEGGGGGAIIDVGADPAAKGTAQVNSILHFFCLLYSFVYSFFCLLRRLRRTRRRCGPFCAKRAIAS